MTPTANEQLEADGLPADVSRSIEAVWARHAGRQPREVETTIMAGTVICTIRGGTVEFSEGMVDPGWSVGERSNAPRPTYRSDALAAVAEATGRQVKFFASHSDSKADVATEIFSLEGP